MKTDVHNHGVPESVLDFFADNPVFGIERTAERHLSGGPEGEYELQAEFYDAEAKVACWTPSDCAIAPLAVSPAKNCPEIAITGVPG